jgi:hypothetical protein
MLHVRGTLNAGVIVMNPTFPAFQPEALHEYNLQLDVGEPTSLHGLTRLQLDGFGNVNATDILADAKVGREGQIERPARGARGQLDPDATQSVFRRVHDFPWQRPFPSRRGIPDEAVVTWTLKRGSAQQQLKLWLGEAEEEPAIAPVLEALRTMLRSISDNQMYL